MRRFTGIHAVLYALFDADGEISRPAMRQQVETCIASGVDGIVVLGLATEVTKLTEAERIRLMADAAADIAGRVPLGVTIYGNSVPEQALMLRAAKDAGAAWVILQPPMGAYGAAATIDFFGAVAALTDLPVAIQNAPALMGRGITGADIATLVARYPNITHLKGEMPVLEIDRIVREAGDSLVVLNGQGGLEMIDNLQVGCQGFVLAPDIADWGVRIWRRWQAGDHAGATDDYAHALPAMVFAMRSLEHLLTYGKRIYGTRAGITIHDRAPARPVSAAGLDAVTRYASRLGRFA
jgi:2-keto-3-deoxy-L-arabinonate dehydratase